MGQAIGSLLFLAMLSFVGWVVYTEINGDIDIDTSVTSHSPTDPSFDSELELADYNTDAVRDLDAVLEDALRNADRAEQLADELEAASGRAYQAASRVETLSHTNGAVPVSRLTTVNAARSAEYASALMRDYASQMKSRLREVELLASDAENAAIAVAKVEETQRDAVLAAARLEESRRELELARAQAFQSERDAAVVSAPRQAEPGYEAVPLEDEDRGPDAIIVVPLEDDEPYEPIP
jgi:hypothetical protein